MPKRPQGRTTSGDGGTGKGDSEATRLANCRDLTGEQLAEILAHLDQLISRMSALDKRLQRLET